MSIEQFVQIVHKIKNVANEVENNFYEIINSVE
jgi:hypothetical protein